MQAPCLKKPWQTLYITIRATVYQ